MKTYQLFYTVLFSAIFLSCEDEHLTLNIHKDQTFEGSFKLKTDDKSYDQSGTSTLEISNGYFKGYTFGGVHAAGRLEVTANKITFMDTVPKYYLANILPPRCLSGTYDYAFDGDKLQLGNKSASGWVEIHTFRLKK